MSAKYLYVSSTLRNLLLPVLIVLCSTPRPLHADPDACASIVPLFPGETWRDPGGQAGDSACFELDLDVAGILMVDVSTTATAPRARLMVAGTAGANAALATRLQQSASSLVIAATPGNHRMRVAAEDPRQPLPPFTLRARFAEGFTKSETNGEIEVDPDPFADPGSAAALRFGVAKSETNGEIEVDPDPFAEPGCHSMAWTKSETNGEIEVDPDPFADSALGFHDLSLVPEPLCRRLAELCLQGNTDDHGDNFACATEIQPGRRVEGEIGNGQGDDRDVFRVWVKALTPIEIQTRGESELAIELYDRHGQRLDLAIGSGPRLVRTLTPGIYFVRLAGHDAAVGGYVLTAGLSSLGR